MGRRIAVTAAAVVGAVAIASGAVALSTGILDTEPQRRDAVGDITALDLAGIAPRSTTVAEVQGAVEIPGPTPGAPPVVVEPAPADVGVPSSAPTAGGTRPDAPGPPSGTAPTSTTIDDHGGSRSGSGGHDGDDD